MAQRRNSIAPNYPHQHNVRKMQDSFAVTPEVLRARDAAQETLHARAAFFRNSIFGRSVFVRAVVEVSNFCRENCAYCGMRRDNKSLARHRAEPERLVELLIKHRPESVTDINIQTGEDPVAVREVVLPLVRTLRRETNLGISVCLGTLSASLYAELKEAGASIYIIKFEIANRARYAAMQAPGTFDERVSTIRSLAASGWNVSSGFIAGLPGQPIEEMVENFDLAAALPLRGCSVSPFIPGEATPLANESQPSVDVTLNSMAALRLMRPDWVIPAVSALNIANPGQGYRRALRLGANLATINLTPTDMREDYLLYRRDRVIMSEERILTAISEEGLVPSKQSLADYYSATPAAMQAA
jgi:biotin synthase